MSKTKIILFSILAVVIIIAVLTDTDTKRSDRTGIGQEHTRIKSQFSPWDGSHNKLTGLIKSSMNDPDSYEHIKTTYSQKTDHLIVITKFRGKNAYGGYVINTIKAKVDLDGNVLKVY